MRSLDAERVERAGWCGVLFVALTVTSFWATGPGALAVINWDQGAYIAGFASGKSGFTDLPWNAHFGIGHVYFAASCVARACGATVIDGFRALNAICFGMAGAILFSVARKLCGSRAVAALLTLCWATFWSSAVLVLTLEDNVLYMPAVAAIVAIVCQRADHWRPRDSVWAGICCALGGLVSWQVIGYIALAGWTALLAPTETRPLRTRIVRIGLLGLAFFGTLVAWCGMVSMCSPHTMRTLLATLFSSPYQKFPKLPVTPLTDVRGALTTLGQAASWLLQHRFFVFENPRPWPARGVGLLFLAVVLTVFVAATRAAVRHRRRALHTVAATLLVYTLLVAFYRDVGFRYVVRMDYLPVLLLPLSAWAASRLPRFSRRTLAVGLLCLAVTQLSLAWRWDLRTLAARPTMKSWMPPVPPGAWYGRNGQSWFGYFRTLARGHRGACAFLFRVQEVDFGDWQFDFDAALWSELPNHYLIGDRSATAFWRYTPRMIDPREAQLLTRCAWMSPDARALLAP